MRTLLCLTVLTAAFAGTLAMDAKEKLTACCKTLNEADKECIDKYCSFDAISQTNILGFLKTCNDRGPTVGQMWDCASSRHDHSECCKAKGVKGKCLEYCAAHDGVPTNYLSYLFCLPSFNDVRDCFFDYLEKNPNLKGQA